MDRRRAADGVGQRRSGGAVVRFESWVGLLLAQSPRGHLIRCDRGLILEHSMHPVGLVE
jgi:hypothetical protein